MLQAWHSWVLRELDLFKSKFRGAAATLLGAGDCRGFSLGALWIGRGGAKGVLAPLHEELSGSHLPAHMGANCTLQSQSRCAWWALCSYHASRVNMPLPVCCSCVLQLGPLLWAGVENAFYEGPLRLRLPVAMQLDPDGAFSFELPLPNAEGNLTQVSRGLFGGGIGAARWWANWLAPGWLVG